MRKTLINLVVLLNLISFLNCRNSSPDRNKSQAAPSLDVTYIANEGFLISSPSKKILIDALFRLGYEYMTPPVHVLEKMEQAQTPFQDIDLLFVTHIHEDHFDAMSVTRHLLNNSKAVLICPKQVVTQIEIIGEKHFSEIKAQIREINLDSMQSTELTEHDINVKVMRMTHGNPVLQNYSYLVNLEGRKILHLADSDATLNNFEMFPWLRNENVDIAFVPTGYMWSKKGRNIIKKYINPKHIILMHITPNNVYNENTKNEEHMNKLKNVTVFSNSLEKRSFFSQNW